MQNDMTYIIDFVARTSFFFGMLAIFLFCMLGLGYFDKMLNYIGKEKQAERLVFWCFVAVITCVIISYGVHKEVIFK